MGRLFYWTYYGGGMICTLTLGGLLGLAARL